MANFLDNLLYGSGGANTVTTVPQAFTPEQVQFMQNLAGSDYAKQANMTQQDVLNAALQGRNLGIQNLDTAIKSAGIRQPDVNNAEEVAAAKAGTFNDYSTPTLQGGLNSHPFLSNVQAGLQENYNNNLLNNATNNTQGSGLAYRIGQGLGTAGRFIDSPLGRGLIAGGIMAAAGGSPALSMATGLTTGVNRQNTKTADSLYRQQLKQMGYTDEQLSQIPGNINNDMFEALSQSMKLNNSRMTYGQLALFDENVKNYLKTNPEMYNQYVPVNFARDVYGKKNELGEATIGKTKAQTEESKSKADLNKAKAENTRNPKPIVHVTKGSKKVTVDMNYNTNGKSNKKVVDSKKHKTNAF